MSRAISAPGGLERFRPKIWQQAMIVVAMGLLLGSPPALGSYFEHCVVYGQVADNPEVSSTGARQMFELQVARAFALPASHASCRDLQQTLQKVTIAASGLQRGEWLLLRRQKEDSLCQPGTTCAREFWELLYRDAEDSGRGYGDD